MPSRLVQWCIVVGIVLGSFCALYSAIVDKVEPSFIVIMLILVFTSQGYSVSPAVRYVVVLQLAIAAFAYLFHLTDSLLSWPISWTNEVKMDALRLLHAAVWGLLAAALFRLTTPTDAQTPIA